MVLFSTSTDISVSTSTNTDISATVPIGVKLKIDYTNNSLLLRIAFWPFYNFSASLKGTYMIPTGGSDTAGYPPYFINCSYLLGINER